MNWLCIKIGGQEVKNPISKFSLLILLLLLAGAITVGIVSVILALARGSSFLYTNFGAQVL